MGTWTSTANPRLSATARRATCIALYIALLCAIAGMAGLAGVAGRDTDHGSTALVAAPTAPIGAPAGDTTQDHDLFNPSATLDARQIDDLRDTPETWCLESGGVVTPEGLCVDAVAVWRDEMSFATWKHLKALGYGRSIDHSEPGRPALWIPAGMVILGGEGRDDVLAVDTCRPLTPR